MNEQRGMTLIGWLIVISIAVLIGTATLRLVPVYLEYFKIVSTLHSVSAEFAGQSPTTGEVRRALGRRFDIESVRALETRDVKIERRGNSYIMRAQYEQRTPFLGNVNFLVAFDKSVEIAF